MTIAEAERTLNEMFDKYVPAKGAADTVGGEVVRAISRLVYRNWNDGDHVGVGYGNETCNAAWRYLCEQMEFDSVVLDALEKLWGVVDDETYDEAMSMAEVAVADYLNDCPELFEVKNDDDMLDWREDSDLDYEEEEEWY